MKLAMQSLGCLILCLEILSIESSPGQSFVLKKYDLSQYMRLDSQAIDALNILPNPGEPNQMQNLFGFLNQCKTAMGSRKLIQWIKQPLLKIKDINERLDIVEVLFNDTTLRETLRDKCFRRIPDLERLTKKIQRQKANLQDVVLIYQFLPLIPHFIEAIKSSESKILEEKFQIKLEKLQNDFKAFENLVEDTIDLDQVPKHEFVIKATWDDQLQDIQQKKK